ncbi:ABC transporter permease [Tepidanaerobacter syntrophicus]|uniref:ABC transporter permease n=1 Tax=Tepidanaerobacter syntrophicus TaxID=224999 RepID=UPI001BD52AE1
MDSNYIASLINSTLRSTTPVLLVALGSAICSQVGVFNIALEGQMLIASFTSIVVNYLTGSVLLAIIAGIISGTIIGAIVAVVQVKYQAADMVVGNSLNLLVAGLTSILLFVILGVRGSFSSPDLIPLGKINISFIRALPFIGRVLADLTVVDYISYVIAILMYIFLFKTVAGFRVHSIGINKEAAESLGVNTLKIRMAAVAFSGALSGLGGSVLSMGQVTLFTENMTAGRGFIAMAAAGMGQNHPLYVIGSSLLFGAAQTLSVSLQNIIPSQLTMTIPYIITIIALSVFGYRTRKQKSMK